MSIEEGMDQLSKQFKGRDWFYDIGTDQYGRLVVYVKYMSHETLHDVPDTAGGIQVLVHFAASKTATRDQFVDKPASSLSPTQFLQAAKEAQAKGIDTGVGQLIDQIVDEFGESALPEEEKSIRFLQNELEKLEKICGSFTLQDIFYEIQDGKNAVTNLSSRYPEVRQRMEKLYDMYGFDVIYEELDG